MVPRKAELAFERLMGESDFSLMKVRLFWKKTAVCISCDTRTRLKSQTVSARRLNGISRQCFTYHAVGTITTLALEIVISTHKSLKANCTRNRHPFFPTKTFYCKTTIPPIQCAQEVRNIIDFLSSHQLSLCKHQENVRLKFKPKSQQCVETNNTPDDVSRATVDIWQSLPLEYIKNLYNSLPKWIRKVLIIKGEISNYWHALTLKCLHNPSLLSAAHWIISLLFMWYDPVYFIKRIKPIINYIHSVNLRIT